MPAPTTAILAPQAQRNLQTHGCGCIQLRGLEVTNVLEQYSGNYLRKPQRCGDLGAPSSDEMQAELHGRRGRRCVAEVRTVLRQPTIHSLRLGSSGPPGMPFSMM